jgi:hypothetical protein
MKPKLYLETTVPSYLTAWPSRDLVRAAHQRLTKEWWETRREKFDIYVSQFVLDEVSLDDPVAAEERLKVLEGIALLEPSPSVSELATALIQRLVLPSKAAADAAHIAVSAVHNMDFLLTWNCTHIANAELRAGIRQICLDHGLQCPVICTPEELMGKSKLYER